MVLIRLPPRGNFLGGPPAYLQAEYARLRVLEKQTLEALHRALGNCGFVEAQQLVTAPLLHNQRPAASPSCSPPQKRRRR